MTSAIGLRAEAARELVRAGELSPETALYLVAWPPAKLEQASEGCERRSGERTTDEKARALKLVAGGASWAQAAREVGVHKQTVGGWVKAQRAAECVARDRGARRGPL